MRRDVGDAMRRGGDKMKKFWWQNTKTGLHTEGILEFFKTSLKAALSNSNRSEVYRR